MVSSGVDSLRHLVQVSRGSRRILIAIIVAGALGGCMGCRRSALVLSRDLSSLKIAKSSARLWSWSVSSHSAAGLPLECAFGASCLCTTVKD